MLRLLRQAIIAYRNGGVVSVVGVSGGLVDKFPVGSMMNRSCFGGSEGGFESQAGNAVLLATHGYAALAASWVAEDEAAKEIASIPLERFAGALNLLRDHPQNQRRPSRGHSGVARRRGSAGRRLPDRRPYLPGVDLDQSEQHDVAGDRQ
jgi:hypothetical protein